MPVTRQEASSELIHMTEEIIKNEKCKCCAKAQSDGEDGLCSVCREGLQSPEIAAELRAIFEEPAEVES